MNKYLVQVALLLLATASFAQEQAGSASQPATPSSAATARERALSIRDAYQRELAFLEAQRHQLQQRMAETRERQRSAEQGLRAEVDQLQADVVTLDERLSQAQAKITHAEQQAISNQENREVLAATLQQAGVTLDQYGIPVLGGDGFQSLADEDKLRTLFAEGLKLVDRLSSIRVEQGTFFSAEGREVSGEILHVGNIAAYGRNEDVAGVLAPAGAQRLKIWPVDSEAAVRELMSGRGSELVPIFLFESLANAVEARGEKGPIDVIGEGGTIGWVIAALGLVVLTMIVLRAFFLHRAGTDTEKLAARIAPLVRAGQRDKALAELKRHRNAPSRVMAAAVRNLDRDRDHIEDIVSESILHESAHLNRFGTAILVIAAVAPLLGLLGTVTGMISTFDIITEFGTGDPKLLSGGIAIALVTTELGLIVAIPALLIGNLLSGWAESIKDDMEKSALHAINVAKSGDPRTAAA